MSLRNKVVIAHQTVVDGDAIGHDVLGMYRTLTGLEYEVYIYAENYIGDFNRHRLNKRELLRLIDEPANVLIYHHSVFWDEGEEIIKHCRSHLILRYHNITPPDFFKTYSQLHYDKTLQGREQTVRFIQNFDQGQWFADSEFNKWDLLKYGLQNEKVIVVPPFHALEDWAGISPNVSLVNQILTSKRKHIFFLGRIAPNKGHKHLINIVKTYMDNFDEDIHLWLVGSIDTHLQGYMKELNDIIQECHIEKNISFTDKLPLQDIKAFFLATDAFVCMSEHEGFCVPLIEAQYLLLPLVTYGGTALKETAGNNQIVLDAIDCNLAAASLYTVFHDSDVRDFCQDKGYQNVSNRFSQQSIQNTFVASFNKVLGSESA